MRGANEACSSSWSALQTANPLMGIEPTSLRMRTANGISHVDRHMKNKHHTQQIFSSAQCAGKVSELVTLTAAAVAITQTSAGTARRAWAT